MGCGTFYKKEKWYERFVKYNASTDFFNFISEEVKEKKILSKLQKFNDVKEIQKRNRNTS